MANNINESTAMITGVLESLQQVVKKSGMTVDSPITQSQNYVKTD